MTTFWFYKMLMFGYSTLNSLYIIIKWNFNMDPCAKKNQKKTKTFRWKIHIECWYMCCIRHARWSPCVKINGLHMSKPVSGYITREIHFYINRVMYYGVMKCLGFFWGGCYHSSKNHFNQSQHKCLAFPPNVAYSIPNPMKKEWGKFYGPVR